MTTRWAALAAALGAVAARGRAVASPSVFLNIIIDDLGWANIGPRSPNPPENETPRLASLAARGVTLARQYNHFTCSPSRAAFSTGRIPLRVQQTLDNPDKLTAGIPFNMTTIAERMGDAGFVPMVFGKWDQGWATTRHTPLGRGYARSLVYAEHMNDYWTQRIEPTGTSCANASLFDLWEDSGPAKALAGTGQYFEDMVFSRALEAIANFSRGALAPARGLYLDVRPHSMHWPLMLKPEDFANFSGVTDDEARCAERFYGEGMWPAALAPGGRAFACRRQYQAMLARLDANIGALEDALVAAGLWDATLVTLFSDNGGVVDQTESAGSNFPLRGGKYRPFEGGVRVTALWSGGFLPPRARGTTAAGLVSVADYAATLCALAGGGAACGADARAAAGGLPPPDSLDVWAHVTGANATSPRAELPVDERVLLRDDGAALWKLVLGSFDGALWTGPVSPNATATDPSAHVLACAPACLFDVRADPGEHADVAAAHPRVVAEMTARLAALQATFYSNSDSGGADLCPAGTKDCLCYAAEHTYGGFLGPWHDFAQ